MTRFTLCFVVQAGRLEAEAVLLVASLLAADPAPPCRIVAMEPEPGPLWPGGAPGITDDLRAWLTEAGVEVRRFPARDFGAAYPHGNKIEGLAVLPESEPFLFLDTDTLVLGPLSGVPFDFNRPSASLRRGPTWPKQVPGGATRAEVWAALYRRFSLDFAASQDPARDPEDWQRYLYFNAGWFLGPCPRRFGARFRDIAVSIRDAPPPELAGQSLDPWLDQVALPLVIHALGGGRDNPCHGWLDGRTTLHYRALPLLYAREAAEVVALLERIAAPNRVKRLLKRHPAFHRMLYRGDGARARALFADGLPGEEREIRQRLRAADLWLR